MRLNKKIALVTAAASGMGRAGVTRFAQEGAQVVAVDVDEKNLSTVVKGLTDAGLDAIGICADLTDDTECARIVTDTVQHYGGLDLLWNHVGHPGYSRVEDLDAADYEITMDLNLRSVFRTTGAAIPAMQSRGGGSILFTASIAGLIGSPFSPLMGSWHPWRVVLPVMAFA
jgi:NAD(P)-dependent dehydrogenase (short-subunit alcohol dehydrogenase family)